MSSPKICLVNSLFPPHDHGGAENYVLRTAKALQRRGYEVTVLTTKPYDGLRSLRPSSNQYEGIKVWRFYPLNLSYRGDGTGKNIAAKALWHQVDTTNPHAVWAAERAFDAIDPDIVHTNNVVGISPAIGRAIRKRDISHVHTLHDYSLICPKSNLLRDLTAPDDERVVCENPPVPCRAHASQKRHVFGKPDIITGPSQHVIDVHRKHGFFDGVLGKRVQLGVKSVVDEPSPVPSEPSFLYVGKQLESKGLDTLYEAARQCEWHIHVCGTGPYAERTESAASTIPNLEYHGYVDDAVLKELRERATAAVVPSIWMENSPLTIYESFAAGLPVIGSNIGGIPELVDTSRGQLVPPKSGEELAAAMTDLAEDIEKNRQMRGNAVAWARSHELDDHVDELSSLYHKVEPSTVESHV